MSRKKIIFFYGVLFFLIFLFFEVSFRAFYAVRFENAKILIQPFSALDKYYKGITKVIGEDVIVDNGSIDLLLLGGSVLNSDWGNIEQELRQYLENIYSCPINIHNVALAANTSLDSRIKYDLLQDKHYDLILLYHGINEVRFNHCPKSIFKTDYSHVDFYTKIYTLTTNKWSRYSILPLVYNQVKNILLQKYSGNYLAPMNTPLRDLGNTDWLNEGLDIKTSQSFYQNYKTIINAAKKKNINLIIPTFAYYLPTNNSQDSIEVPFDSQVGIWGTAETVVKGINTHNKVVKNLAQQVTDKDLVYIVNMNREIIKSKVNFQDICHLTPKGSIEYVSILQETIKKILDKNTVCAKNL